MHTLAAVILGLALLSLPVVPAAALESLDDAAMETVSGAGIALAFDDFQFAMAPTSYFEQVGTAPAGACTGTGSAASNLNCWRRGDLRWYGVNISGGIAGSTGYKWNDSTTCDAGSLNCPRGGTIANFSPFDNPYLIRAASPSGMDRAGNCINGSTPPACTGAGAITKSIYEFAAPTSQPNYTFSWWGEIEVGSTRDWSTIAAGTANPLSVGQGTVLKSQNIIRGNAAGSIFRAFILADAADPTFGLLYHSRLKGDYRFSINQSTAAGGVVNDTIGQAPVFADTEGMTFRNVVAYIPLGQLYYQALTVDAVGTAGGFAINLTAINDAVAAKHYALNTGDTQGYETARMNNTGGANTAGYDLTHGFSRWGGWSATGTYTTNAINDASDGIVFSACTGCANFYAYADTPVTIDKRANLPSGGGRSFDEERIRNYECDVGNTGVNCITTSPPGPTTVGTTTTPARNIGAVGLTAGTRTYPTAVVNLGDARIEGLMINQLRIESCSAVVGGC